MAEPLIDLDFNRHAQDLCETWQGRLLRETHDILDLHAVVLSVLAHNFDDSFFVLLKAVLNIDTITAPFICSAAKIDKSGFIVADMVHRREPFVRKDCLIFYSAHHMETLFRRIADRLKFNDDDRRQLFAAVRNWVVADRRLDPAMDPADPDARRLVVH